MRLFIAIHLPAGLYAYCRALQRQFPGMKNVKQFHLTLQFLGDNIPKERLSAIKDRLSPIEFAPFPIALGEAVPFPNPKAPRGVWILCRGGAALHQLAERVRAAMGNLGYLPEERFLAHVTLGRYLAYRQAGKKGPPAVPKPLPGEPLFFTANAFRLMQSHLSSAGSAYKTLATFRAAH